MANPMTVVVDDDPACLAAIASELRECGITARAYPSTRELLLPGTPLNRATSLLLDLMLEDGPAFPFMAEARRRFPKLPIIALTGHASDDLILNALRCGAVGYLLKHDALGRLGEVLTVVEQGGSPITPSVARRVLSAFHDPKPLNPLTPRELDVLRTLAQGHTYEGAGVVLGVAIDTIRAHVRQIYRKLEASSKAEAVAIALRGGLLQ